MSRPSATYPNSAVAPVDEQAGLVTVYEKCATQLRRVDSQLGLRMRWDGVASPIHWSTPATTSAVVCGNAFQLAKAIHGLCTASHNDAAKTETVTCGIDIANRVDLAVKIPPGAWKSYLISYSGTTINPVQKLVRNGSLYLAFVGAVTDTIKKVTFTS
jgi:hypothetical protein